MKTWLIIYSICGVTFTALMYVKNLYKNATSFASQVQKILVSKKSIGDRAIEIIGTSLALFAVSIFWVFFVCWLIYEKFFQKKNADINNESKFNATKDSLIRTINPVEEERNHIIKDPFGRVPGHPFGHLHQAWINFLADSEPEDEIWSFQINVGDMVTTWYSNDKRPSTRLIKGFACLHGGKVVNEFIYESS